MIDPVKSFPEDVGYPNGDATCVCARCSAEFAGHFRRTICKSCVALETVMAPKLIAQADEGVSLS